MDQTFTSVAQHKLGADRPETFLATPVDPKNRLRALGHEREMQVRENYPL